MGFFTSLLTLPVMGGPLLVGWVARTIAEETQRQSLDEGPLRFRLLQLQELYDAGELSDEEYDSQERALLEHLNAIREVK
ncbi:MAG: gas vesicle protein GvpG [Dehalococcoidia bacterium]|nr:gas vesicle protein GvpG [Dehalococcoidia bacterium]